MSIAQASTFDIEPTSFRITARPPAVERTHDATENVRNRAIFTDVLHRLPLLAPIAERAEQEQAGA